MKKLYIYSVILVSILALTLFSCAKKPNNYKHEKERIKKEKSNQNGESITDDSIVEETENWTDYFLSELDEANYLSHEEKMVIVEANKCRTNPRRYAEEVLTPFLNSISDDNIFIYHGQRIQLTEGKSAVLEAIEELEKSSPCSALLPDENCHKAAVYHNDDQGPKGTVGHNGTKGDTPSDRLRRFNSESIGCSECISYGYNEGEYIMIQLIVDDGVKSRGHRKGMMNKDIKLIGPAIGNHKKFGFMCTVDCTFN